MLARRALAKKDEAVNIAHSHAHNVVERWRAPEFDAIELHRGAAITSQYPRHWHDELYLNAIVDGGGELDCVGGSQATRPGTLILIPSGEVHADRKRECSFRCMFIEFSAVRATLEQFVAQSVPEINFRTELIQDKRTISNFLQLHHSLEADGSRLGPDAAVAVFFHRLVSRHSTASLPLARDGNENFAVQRTRRFLDEHFAERVSLQDLAKLTGLSAFYLHRSFCRKIGMPPHAYQVQARITRALSLLRRGRSISDAASSVGFVDQSHFSRHFKRSTGVTPGQFVQSEQERTRRATSHALSSVA
jgi:AraC-like DNA-binding protein